MKWYPMVNGTKVVAPSTIKNVSQVQHIRDLKPNYSVGTKTLTFYAEVASQSKNSSYTTIVSFLNVDPTEGLIEEEIAQGFLPKPSLSEHDIQVRCSCSSYRFRHYAANKSHGAATGRGFPAYIRKTNRAPNNPDDISSVCKHLIELVDYLVKTNFIYE